MWGSEWDSGLTAVQVREGLADALRRAGGKLAARRAALLAEPADVENLHQYRISVRVARSLVKFCAPYLKKSQGRRLKEALKELQDPTSRVRELDVLVPELDSTPDLQERCRKRQDATRAAFLSTLALPETAARTAWAVDELSRPRWKREVARHGIDAVALACRVDALRDSCERQLRRVDFADQEAVHDLRKRAKALRYVTREAKDVLPAGLGQVSGGMKAMQDQLGAWCDARVDAALVAEICGEAGADVAARFQARADEALEQLHEARE